MIDPALIQKSDIHKGDLLFVYIKDADQADVQSLQDQLDEHFIPQGVLAIASSYEIEMHQASAPKPGELLWIGIEDGTQADVDEARQVIDEHFHIPEGEDTGGIILSNFSPEIVTMNEDRLNATQAMLDTLLDMAKEKRATIKMVFPQKEVLGSPQTDPEGHAQLARDNALFDATEAFMTERLVDAGYVVPANMRDLIAEFVMACENPPVETASTSRRPTEVYTEDEAGNRVLLGTAETWTRSETRMVDQRMSVGSDKIEALEPVPGSYRSEMSLLGFVPVEKP